MNAEKDKRNKLHRVGKYLNNNRYSSDNGGFSLVELVIVIAIIAIIMGVTFYSIIIIFSANAKSCANDIQRSIADCKVTTMGRTKAYMELYRDSDQKVYSKMYIWDRGAGDYVEGEPQQIGTNRVYVGYVPEGGTEAELTAGTKIRICYDRANGGFKEDPIDGKTYEMLYVRGGSKDYEIRLTKLTGKSELISK
ncbi:MAG: prepilin-type N-terminal cleavage/methylation domain-containing protein [Bacteroidales bacterium]|nr:prepilin-type N-terminal cleavage/methylation domain-containing protein [Bacteroidales bacterium]MCM1415126.1 prepilin-type N-terminal cleavage/methylation domain-containing protein [bacterium]MCM1423038.1 prepilin-type N-terminal cleavage/methylation domain-containing protein [bacterium]